MGSLRKFSISILLLIALSLSGAAADSLQPAQSFPQTQPVQFTRSVQVGAQTQTSVAPKKPVILIFSASYGGGHNTSAAAIQEIIAAALEERKKQGLPNSEVEIKIIKSEKYLPLGLNQGSIKLFDFLYSHAPKVYDAVWQITMMMNQGKESAGDISTFPFSKKELYDDLKKYDPVAVYSTHHITTDMLLDLRKQGKISVKNFPILWMNTDFVPSTLEKWQDYSEALQVAKDIVAKSKEKLMLRLKRGVDRDEKVAQLDLLSKQISDLKAHAKDLVKRDSDQAVLDGTAQPKLLKFFELPGRDVEMVGSPHPGMTKTFIDHGQPPEKIGTTLLPISKRAFLPMSDEERERFLKTALTTPDLAKDPGKGIWVNGRVQKPEDPNPVGLDPAVKTIFITSGAAGLGDYQAIVNRLFALAQSKGIKLQIVANCGKNSKNFNDLTKSVKVPDGSVLAVSQLLDNTKQVDYFRSMSKGRGVYIGKSGSQTPQEAAVSGSLSVVLDILGGQEHNTSVFLGVNGLAEVVGSSNQAQAADRAFELLENPEKQSRQFAAAEVLRQSADDTLYSKFAISALEPEAMQHRISVGNLPTRTATAIRVQKLRCFVTLLSQLGRSL